jgi:hypothetical protein
VFASVGVYDEEGRVGCVKEREERQGMHDATTCRDKIKVVVRCMC